MYKMLINTMKTSYIYHKISRSITCATGVPQTPLQHSIWQIAIIY